MSTTSTATCVVPRCGETASTAVSLLIHEQPTGWLLCPIHTSLFHMDMRRERLPFVEVVDERPVTGIPFQRRSTE